MALRGIVPGALLVVALLTGCPRPPVTPPEPPSPPVLPSTPAPTPLPTPAPTPWVPNKRLDVGKIFNGVQLRASLQTEKGTTAMTEREEPGSYSLELKLNVKVPQPYKDLASLAKLNPQLPALLPALPTLLESGKISPSFDELYRLKVAAVQASLLRLDNLLTRHNFFDCETLLELQHPETMRRALLIQADMDTDTDGSDSDRVPEIDGSSATFQPFTSYKWTKKTPAVNSFLAPREAAVKQLQAELPGARPGRQQEIKSNLHRLGEEISDLKKYSYLVAATDPYVVLPGSLFAPRNRSAFSPAVGDYCVVISGNILYPAIVGDAGPPNIMGESSLRLCRQIYAKADANNRAVEDLKVTYLVFPGSADRPFDVPDLKKWHDRCETLLKELGGFEGQLMVWEDLTKPKPPPAPPVPATPAPTTPRPATPAPATPAPATPVPKP